MRTLLYTALVSSPEILAALPGGIHDHGAVGGQAGIIPALPFLVQKVLRRTNGISRRTLDMRAEIWIYGPPKDYTIIEDSLEVVRKFLDGHVAISRTAPDGRKLWLTSVEYEETSPDFTDDSYQATVKWDTYRHVGNYE